MCIYIDVTYPYSIRLWLCQEHIQIPCAYVLCKVGCCSHLQFCMEPAACPGCIYFNLALKWTSSRAQIYGYELYVQQKCLWKEQLGSTVEVRKIRQSFYFFFLVMKYSNVSHCTVKSNLKSNYTFMCHKKTLNISASEPVYFNKKYNYFWLIHYIRSYLIGMKFQF